VQPGTEHQDIDLVNNKINNPDVAILMKTRKLYIATRQVPSCTLLTSLGMRIKPENVSIIQELGFPLMYRRKGEVSFRKLSGFKDSASAVSGDQKSYLSSLLENIVKENRRLFDPDVSDEESDLSEVNQMEYLEGESDDGSNFEYKFDFMDPFDIIKAYHVQERLGINPSEILVWPGGVKRITDQIPAKLLNSVVEEGEKSFRRKTHFSHIENIETKLSIILKHTHWGKLLQRLCKPTTEEHRRRWALTLRKRIKFFLEGKFDPLWSRDQMRQMSPPLMVGPLLKGDSDRSSNFELRDTKTRAERFFQVLRTIDGTFLQLYLGNLGAAWNWEFFDNFVLGQLNQHLSDEFVDGTIYDWEIMDYPTYYERLKVFRGKIKESFLRNVEFPQLDEETILFRSQIRLLMRLPEGHYRTQLGGIMIQTRGCGTPPPIVSLRSKIKFLKSTSTAPEPLKRSQLHVVDIVLRGILQDIPDHVFTGLTTKAGVNPTTSACFENLREEGGTSEHVRTIVREGKLGRRIKMINLDTGDHVDFKTLEEVGIGSYIFWRCLEEVMSMPPEVLREAIVVMINEPGKSRTVTKAHAALKVILDAINGICSYPLRKGVESSSSGMGKSHHGWNAFTSFYEEKDIRELIFTIKSKISKPFTIGVDEVEYQYERCWTSFTDFSEATDKSDHKINSYVAEKWMQKCGIPIILRGIVHETCFKPRKIFYHATGILEDLGEYDPLKGMHFIILRRGILMGDPLTKVCLHLTNKIARDTAKILSATDKTLDLLQYHSGKAREAVARSLNRTFLRKETEVV
jgi:hypothetical protein